MKCKDCAAFKCIPKGNEGYCNRAVSKRYVKKIQKKNGGFFSKDMKACKDNIPK